MKKFQNIDKLSQEGRHSVRCPSTSVRWSALPSASGRTIQTTWTDSGRTMRTDSGRTADGCGRTGAYLELSVRCPSAVRPLSVRIRPLANNGSREIERLSIVTKLHCPCAVCVPSVRCPSAVRPHPSAVRPHPSAVRPHLSVRRADGQTKQPGRTADGCALQRTDADGQRTAYNKLCRPSC